jgi:16S rRNA (guanine(527)-N(7))-methyltransferase RsmG
VTNARIAELLEPFLHPTTTQNPCHSESGQRPGEEPAVLSPAQLQHISTYIDILLRWNARINLTAIRDPEEIITRHFGESLFAARHLFPREVHVGTAVQACPERSRRGCPAERSSTAPEILAEQSGRAALQRRVKNGEKTGALAPDAAAIDEQSATDKPSAAKRRQNIAHRASRGLEPAISQAPEGRKITVADIGSGAGFPGIPIKLWAPYISLTLIESNHKKATFLREIARALTLTDINIQTTRAESFKTTFDVVTLRAVERFEAILPVAANLVAPNGRLAVLVGSSQLEQAHSRFPQFSWINPQHIPASRSRVLAIASRSV